MAAQYFVGKVFVQVILYEFIYLMYGVPVRPACHLGYLQKGGYGFKQPYGGIYLGGRVSGYGADGGCHLFVAVKILPAAGKYLCQGIRIVFLRQHMREYGVSHYVRIQPYGGYRLGQARVADVLVRLARTARAHKGFAVAPRACVASRLPFAYARAERRRIFGVFRDEVELFVEHGYPNADHGVKIL